MLRHLTESDRALVEQAKGVLMLRYGVGSRESLAVLNRWVHDSSIPLPEVADALVSGVCQGRVTPDTEGTVRWLEQRLRGGVDSPVDAGAAMAPSSTNVAAETPPTPRPAVTAALGRRQWRYHSALHAARVTRSS